MAEELITFYEVVEIALHRRLRKWVEEHPEDPRYPKATIVFNHSGWNELLATMPTSAHISYNFPGGSIELYGGTRCRPFRGKKWTRRSNYTIQIRTALRLRQNPVP